MAQYKDLKTGHIVDVADEKNFTFPATGAKILLKVRPPISKASSTD
jgi:hypothetical protein